MAVTVAVRPPVLEWAQRRSGRADDDMRSKFANWDQWLSEERQPRLAEVEAVAQFTHVPVGYLFLSEPPREELPIPDFRTGRGETGAPTDDLLETIYLNQRRQKWYEDYLAELGDAEPLTFVGSARHASVENAAAGIRQSLGYEVESRQHMRTLDEVRNHLINSFEGLGGLVVINSMVENNSHRMLDLDEFRGFTLQSPVAPLVFVNARDTKRGQVFSLLHEFAHVWRGEFGVSAGGAVLQDSGNHVERWCNAVAAEVAVPADDLRIQFNVTAALTQELDRLSERYKCSTLVILIKLRDLMILDRKVFQKTYEDEVERLLGLAEKVPRGKGGDFYGNQSFRVGRTLSRAIVRDALRGATSMTEALRLMSFKSVSVFDRYADRLREAG
ncbi:ImmA/IrrE family metallo-endopeptidase [Actinomyces sp. ZJ308]|uniref:ImmA/IrrE family metallo-endopeptidase n=1 Tax=Actinomyces sp. ZJ308 TaxID=2708342 RepID=UPI001FBA1C5C|nr:ImmA/IrrE family metallo-endopeptidase [Actinomyces sp. ZJ308]